jgi:leucyl aminopeptidase
MSNLCTQSIEVTWAQSLPAVLQWLDKVKVSAAVTVSSHSLIVMPVTQEKDVIQFPKSNVSTEMQTKMRAQAKLIGWSGSKGSQLIIIDDRPVLLVSQSKLKTTVVQIARQLGLEAASALTAIDFSHLSFIGTSELSGLDIFDGFLQGLYSVGGFKKGPVEIPKRWPEAVEVLSVSNVEIQNALGLARSVLIARHLQDAPPNWLTPARFSEVSQDLGREFGFKVSVKGRDEIKALGMGAMAGVAAGSINDPRLIIMELEGDDTSKSIALIGKGLTFDSGGISIKPSDGMDEMKYDMSGGAAVLGAMLALSRSKPACRVVGLIGAVENMPGHTALKPGDIVKSMSGKTIEVLNTDAEGRLVLIDVMEYALKNFKPSLMIDVATLTGAVLVALGKSGAGVMTNNEKAGEFVVDVARRSGEPCWILPLWPELAQEVTSEVADFKNLAASSVKGGSITAGAFLREFAGDTPWVHLDIAGTGWNAKITGVPTKGGSGYGVRALVQICKEANAYLK